jgi:hypothetical protein
VNLQYDIAGDRSRAQGSCDRGVGSVHELGADMDMIRAAFVRTIWTLTRGVTLNPFLSSAGGPAGIRRRPTQTRTAAQVSAAVGLFRQGGWSGDDRSCTSFVTMPMVDGAGGQLDIVPPSRPPSCRDLAADAGFQGKGEEAFERCRWIGAAALGVTTRESPTGLMELSDFAIGETFWTHHGAFRRTDIGTRVVVAVKLGPREVSRAESVDATLRITKRIEDDASWLNGPPYAVEEVVFDENELVGCFRTEAELLSDGEAD